MDEILCIVCGEVLSEDEILALGDENVPICENCEVENMLMEDYLD